MAKPFKIEVDPAWKNLPDDPAFPPLFDGDNNPGLIRPPSRTPGTPSECPPGPRGAVY